MNRFLQSHSVATVSREKGRPCFRIGIERVTSPKELRDKYAQTVASSQQEITA